MLQLREAYTPPIVGTRASISVAGSVRVGAADSPLISATPEISLISTPKSAMDVFDAVDEALTCFRRDVALDACSDSYGPECVGKDPEVDYVETCIRSMEARGEVVDAASCLRCAGVEATSDNVSRFATCVKTRLGRFTDVPRGTLADCAVAVRRGIGKGKLTAHTTKTYRDDLEKWSRQFEIARDKWKTAAFGEVGIWGGATGPSLSDAEPWATQYNAFRDRFVEAGGSTACPSIEIPSGFPWKWIIIGAIVVAASVVANNLGLVDAVKAIFSKKAA